jgi:hypothetical protein
MVCRGLVHGEDALILTGKLLVKDLRDLGTVPTEIEGGLPVVSIMPLGLAVSY